jgi:hypothetical protein
VGSSLLTEGDVSIFGLRYSDSEIARVATIQVDSRYPVTNSLRLLYRFARRYQLELEGGGDLGSRSGDANTDTTAYFIYAGYRAEF